MNQLKSKYFYWDVAPIMCHTKTSAVRRPDRPVGVRGRDRSYRKRDREHLEEQPMQLLSCKLSLNIAGGKVTVQQYLEGNLNLATDLLVKAKKEIGSSSYIGSYSAAVTPNYVSVPLKRKTKIVSITAETKQQQPSCNDHQNDNNNHLDEQQLLRQIQQVFD
ncbi:hypothetical protein ACROYT_G014272 [Oculina patagonica]